MSDSRGRLQHPFQTGLAVKKVEPLGTCNTRGLEKSSSTGPSMDIVASICRYTTTQDTAPGIFATAERLPLADIGGPSSQATAEPGSYSKSTLTGLSSWNTATAERFSQATTEPGLFPTIISRRGCAGTGVTDEGRGPCASAALDKNQEGLSSRVKTFVGVPPRDTDHKGLDAGDFPKETTKSNSPESLNRASDADVIRLTSADTLSLSAFQRRLREARPQEVKDADSVSFYKTACNDVPLTRSPLGIKVSNSEAPQNAGFSPPSSAPTVSVFPLRPLELAEALRPLQASSQAKRCGSWIGGKARLSTFGDGNHGIIGYTASCSSPRCPRCRVSLMSSRKDEIQACIDWWVASLPGASVSMLTLTAPHTPDHSLPRLLGSTKKRNGLAGAVALLKERALWKRDVVQYVSGQETTQGGNGWHPHYHLLIFHLGELDVEQWYKSWAKACKDAGLGRPSRMHGLTLQPAESAAGYMAKWGLASESTGAHVKDAKHGNRAIWDIEQSAASGDSSTKNLLRHYYRAMRRRRTHTFSRGLAPVRLKHALGFQPSRAHFLFDAASSFRLHQDRDFKAVLLQVLADYQLPVMQVFRDLGLEAQPVDYSITPEPQMPYSVRRRSKRLLERVFMGDIRPISQVEKQCIDLINEKKVCSLSIINDRKFF